jgi:hypothetical protein
MIPAVPMQVAVGIRLEVQGVDDGVRVVERLEPCTDLLFDRQERQPAVSEE